MAPASIVPRRESSHTPPVGAKATKAVEKLERGPRRRDAGLTDHRRAARRRRSSGRIISRRLSCAERVPRRLSNTARATAGRRFRTSAETRLARSTNTFPRAAPSPGRPRLARTHQSIEAALQILIVGRRPLIHDHEIGVEMFHAPVIVGAHQLTNDFQIFGFVDPNQHNREIAGDSARPQLRLSALTPLQYFRRGAQRWVRVEHAISQTLEQMRFVGTDAQMMKLDLR